MDGWLCVWKKKEEETSRRSRGFKYPLAPETIHGRGEWMFHAQVTVWKWSMTPMNPSSCVIRCLMNGHAHVTRGKWSMTPMNARNFVIHRLIYIDRVTDRLVQLCYWVFVKRRHWDITMLISHTVKLHKWWSRHVKEACVERCRSLCTYPKPMWMHLEWQYMLLFPLP